MDLKGNIAAIFLREYREDEEQKALAGKGWSLATAMSVATGGQDRYRIFTVSELRDPIQNPSQYLDKRVIHLTKEEEKRRLWLGVEFSRMSAELAKNMGCEKATKWGKIGLLVSHVYEDSPASAAGIKSGDILIKIKEEGKEYTAELKPSVGSSPLGFDFSGIELPEGMDALGYKLPPKKSWRSRHNYLTMLLDAIGRDKIIELSYLQDGKLDTKKVRIERAPFDYDSAPSYKNEALGITVKQLTYEARHALNLGPDAGGVIVSKVEPGSPAAMAKVKLYELITHAEGRAIESPESLENVVLEAKKAGNATIRISITHLGRSRIANLTIPR